MPWFKFDPRDILPDWAWATIALCLVIIAVVAIILFVPTR